MSCQCNCCELKQNLKFHSVYKQTYSHLLALIIWCLPDRGLQWGYDSNCRYLYFEWNLNDIFEGFRDVIETHSCYGNPGWIQYAKGDKRKCHNKALGHWRTEEIPSNVGTLLSWCFCYSVLTFSWYPLFTNIYTYIQQAYVTQSHTQLFFLLFVIEDFCFRFRAQLRYRETNLCLFGTFMII